jgi:internalin A
MRQESQADYADLASTKQNAKEVKLQPKEPSKDTIRDKVFICYRHKDERWLNDLQTHLKPYVRNGLTAWSDKQIAPGSKWLPEIEISLASAKVAVLLVTPDFLASDFIHEKELGPLLKKAEKGKVRIIWIPVRACSYKETLLKDYQAAGDPEKPLEIMKANRNKAWVKICEEIKKAVQEK